MNFQLTKTELSEKIRNKISEINQDDLGKLLVDKNGEELSEIIRNKTSEAPHFLDQAIFSVIEQMAAYASNNVKRVVIKP